MIITYDKSKVYNPNDEKHRIRRAVKLEVDRFYTHNRWESLALKTILKFPGLKTCIQLLVNKGQKYLQMEGKDKEELWLYPTQSLLDKK